MNSMIFKEWKYYNHAAIPSTPPHENVDTSIVNNGDIWKMKESPILARWTSNFDCDNETSWWWVIKESPYLYDELPSKTRKHIKQSLKKCTVKKINYMEEIDDIWRVYEAAYKRYKLADNFISREKFYANAKNMTGIDCWAAYDSESERMIGWMSCGVFEDYVEMITAKYDADYLNRRASDAIHHTVCEYYLNLLSKKYISAGERSVNHITHSQEYKINTFQFRKAYCNLNIRYKGWLKVVVKLLYPIRKIMEKIAVTPFLHNIVIVLKMEEIIRTDNRSGNN